MFQFDKKTQYISDSTNEINGLIFQIVWSGYELKHSHSDHYRLFVRYFLGKWDINA